jgi:hypothetical protein
MALGTAANFGIVGKGGVQVKSLEGPVLKTVAVAEEVVKNWIFRKRYSMFRGFSSMTSSCCWAQAMVKSHFGKSGKLKRGRSLANPK